MGVNEFGVTFVGPTGQIESSTLDMDNLGKPVVPTAETPPAETPAEEPAPSPTPGDASPTPAEPSPTEAEPDEDEEPEEAASTDGKESRSQRWRRKRREELEAAKAEAERERRRADDYWQALREAQQKPSVEPPEATPPPEWQAYLRGDDPQDPEPERVAWDGESDYEQHLVEQAERRATWAARQQYRAEARKNEVRQRQQTEQQQVQTWAEKHDTLAQAAGVTVPAVELVRLATPTMQDFFLNEPDGAEVSVYLRQHLDEVQRMRTLPPRAQVRELSVIAATKLTQAETPKAEPARTHTSASPVVQPVTPTATAGNGFDPSDPESVKDPDYYTKFLQWSQRRAEARGR